MHLLEKGPFKSWMCMNEVEIGKTFTYLSSVVLAYMDLVRSKEAGEEIIARPTIMELPGWYKTFCRWGCRRGCHPADTIIKGQPAMLIVARWVDESCYAV